MVTQVMAGTWTPNAFFYKPDVGARGAQEKNIFDSGFDRVDTRLGNENWLNDPAFGENLQAAIAAIGNTTAVLNIPSGIWPIASDLTIPANITLNLPRGAILNIVTGKTLSINGGLGTGPYKIFNCTGTGKVVLNCISEVFPEWWGAVGDGTTDDTTALKAALTNCATTGGTLTLTAKTYKFTSSLTWACYTHAIRGSNTRLLASGIAGFALIARDLMGAYGNFSWVDNKGMEGVWLTTGHVISYNDHPITGEHGLYLGDTPPSTTHGGAYVNLRNCVISGFDTPIQWGNNSFSQSFDTVQLFGNNRGPYYPYGLSNSGEAICFTNCGIFNSDLGLETHGGFFCLYGCRLDYLSGKSLYAAAGGRIQMFGGHIESNADSDYWIVARDDQSLVSLNNVSIYNSAGTKTYEYGLADSSGIVSFDSCVFATNTYGPTYLIKQNNHGQVYCRNTFPYEPISSHITPLTCAALSLLADGEFEYGYATDWTLTGTAPALDATDKHSRTNSLKIAPTIGTSTLLAHNIPARPGDKVAVSFWIKNTFGVSVDTFTVSMRYLDSAGNSPGYKNYDMEFSAAGTHYTTWTQVFLSTYGPAPAGAASIIVRVEATGTDGIAVNRIDDVAITVN